MQELLGYFTISITSDTYSHVLPGMETIAAIESVPFQPSSSSKSEETRRCCRVSHQLIEADPRKGPPRVGFR